MATPHWYANGLKNVEKGLVDPPARALDTAQGEHTHG